jgi:hypothetical protein
MAWTIMKAKHRLNWGVLPIHLFLSFELKQFLSRPSSSFQWNQAIRHWRSSLSICLPPGITSYLISNPHLLSKSQGKEKYCGAEKMASGWLLGKSHIC